MLHTDASGKRIFRDNVSLHFYVKSTTSGFIFLKYFKSIKTFATPSITVVKCLLISKPTRILKINPYGFEFGYYTNFFYEYCGVNSIFPSFSSRLFLSKDNTHLKVPNSSCVIFNWHIVLASKSNNSIDVIPE